MVVLPDCLADHIGSLVPGIERALNVSRDVQYIYLCTFSVVFCSFAHVSCFFPSRINLLHQT